MNKADVVRAMEETLGSRQLAIDALDAFIDAIIREVSAGGKVAITGFGTFERVDRAQRTGRNPRTGDVLRIDPTQAPRFRPGTLFREFVADPSSLPTRGTLVGGRASSQRDEDW